MFSGLVRSLSSSAHKRMSEAFAPSTQKMYLTMFRTYLAFLAFITVLPNQVNVDIALAFLEFLHFNNFSINQMANHVSAIKSFSVRLNLPFEIFEHSKVVTYLKALKRTAPCKIQIHNIIDIPLLYQICEKCQLTHLGKIFRAIYLCAFFGFLR